jgi:F0F1-type ATP synthase assembly protein I
MAQDNRGSDVARSSSEGARDTSVSAAWTVLSHLISGFLFFGAIGWGLQYLTGSPWFLAVGLLLGGVASGALIYYRYVYIPPNAHPRPGEGLASGDRKEHHG